MESKEPAANKPANKDISKVKESAPLMILSSGRVVGNVGPQWKEVRDNRGKQIDVAGKEIIPARNSPPQNVKLAGNLNPNSASFVPGTSGIPMNREKENLPVVESGKGEDLLPKESAADWVRKSFSGNVSTNKSCQEIPSQSINTTMPENISNEVERVPSELMDTNTKTNAEQANLKECIEKHGGRLWADQVEDDSDEGDL